MKIRNLHSPSARRHFDCCEKGFLDFEVFDERSEVAIDDVCMLAVVAEVLQHLLNAVDAVEHRLHHNTSIEHCNNPKKPEQNQTFPVMERSACSRFPTSSRNAPIDCCIEFSSRQS